MRRNSGQKGGRLYRSSDGPVTAGGQASSRVPLIPLEFVKRFA
jgi:hypothetical protein